MRKEKKKEMKGREREKVNTDITKNSITLFHERFCHSFFLQKLFRSVFFAQDKSFSMLTNNKCFCFLLRRVLYFVVLVLVVLRPFIFCFNFFRLSTSSLVYFIFRYSSLKKTRKRRKQNKKVQTFFV